MNKIILLLVSVLLFAKTQIELKEVKTYNNTILMVKKIDNKLYLAINNDWPYEGKLKNFFITDGKDILIGADKNDILIVKDEKKLKLKGKYLNTVKKNDIIYIATPHKIYGIDKNLKIVYTRKFVYKIDNLLLYKNKLFVVVDKEFKLLKGIGKIDFSDKILAFNVRFLMDGEKLFAIYENLFKDLSIKIGYKNYDYFKKYVIENLSDDYGIEVEQIPLKIKVIGDSLYLLYKDRVEKYEEKRFKWKIYTNETPIDLIKHNNSLYLITSKKVYKIVTKIKIEALEIGGLKCVKTDDIPVFMGEFSSPLLITRGEKYKITLYDENFSLLWSKKINAKINSAKVIGNNIYLTGIKGGRFWVAKMSLNGEMLKERTFYKAAQGFDIAENDNGFVAVGYKYFDHLGDYIKRFVIVLLDKDLNFITDRTYGDFESAGIRVVRAGEMFVGIQKVARGYFIVIFNKGGFLKWYKALSPDKYYLRDFYDIKPLDRIFFSTDRGVFVLNRDKTIAKFRDFKDVIKIIDKNRFITHSGIFVNDKSFNLNIDIIDGIYNGNNYYFLGYVKDIGMVCKY